VRLALVMLLLPGCGLLLDFGGAEGGDGSVPRDGGSSDTGVDAGVPIAVCPLEAVEHVAPDPTPGGVDLAIKPEGLLGARRTSPVGLVIAEEFVAGSIGPSHGEVLEMLASDRVAIATSESDLFLATFSIELAQASFASTLPSTLDSIANSYAFDVASTNDDRLPFVVAAIENSEFLVTIQGITREGVAGPTIDLEGAHVDVAIEPGLRGTVDVGLIERAPPGEMTNVHLAVVDSTRTVSTAAVGSIMRWVDEQGERTIRIVRVADEVYVLVAGVNPEDSTRLQHLVRMSPDGASNLVPNGGTVVTSERAAIAVHPLAPDLLALVYSLEDGVRFEVRDRFDLESVVNAVDVPGARATSIALEYDPSGAALFVALISDDGAPSARYVEFLCR
jgi:hypothetical protein